MPAPKKAGQFRKAVKPRKVAFDRLKHKKFDPAVHIERRKKAPDVLQVLSPKYKTSGKISLSNRMHSNGSL